MLTCFKKLMKSQSYEINHSNNIQSHDKPLCTNNANHIRFKYHSIHPINNSEKEYRLLDMTHEFPEKDFFGHQPPDSKNLIDSIWPIEKLPSLSISFANENLNSAAACILLYMTETFDFFHIMIKSITMKSFLQAMNEDGGISRTLPFSCWCDGGVYEETEYRQHRHFIIVSPKNHFNEKVWPKIKLSKEDKPPYPKYPCKRLKLIDSPMHLVNTIGYLSRRESQCKFSFFENESVNTRNNHFYIYKTLPKEFKLHLVLLWKDGLFQYLKQTKFQNVSIARLAEGVLTHDGQQWTQKIKDFYDHERGMVIYVDKDYIPTDRVTPHFLHLMNDRVLYFDKSPENRKLDQDTWLKKQVEGGNCFYDAVEENEWIPQPRDQAILNLYKPVIDKNRKLESKIAELEERNRELEKRIMN